MDDKQLKEGLSALFEGILGSQDADTNQQYGETIQRVLSNGKYDFKNPELFNLFINFELDEIKELMVKGLFQDTEIENLDEFCFLYTHYDFINQNVEQFIQKKEGAVCCADKSKWLLESYREYLINENTPDMTVEEKCFWKPRFGSAEEWMNLMDGLHDLYYGYPEKYLKALAQLTKRKDEMR